ncbi:MAG: cyanophycin synthetase, partial [Pseudomonadota bacterium]
ASAALAALDVLRVRLPVTLRQICRGFASVALPGRFQVLPGSPTVVLDVGHNPQAAAVLVDNLSEMDSCRTTWAVFGMLRDKDIASVVNLLAKQVDHWMVCTLPPPRGAEAAQLAQVLRRAGVDAVREFENPAAAYAAALGEAGESDRILVFGSFYTVADILAARDSSKLKA